MKRRPDPMWDVVAICEICVRASIVRECSTAAMRRFLKAYKWLEGTCNRGDDLATARLRTLRDDVRREVASRGRVTRKARTPKTKNYDL
jgi:hypothetical protein